MSENLKVKIRGNVSEIFQKVEASRGPAGENVRITPFPDKIEEAIGICAQCQLLFCTKIKLEGKKAITTITTGITTEPEEIAQLLNQSSCMDAKVGE